MQSSLLFLVFFVFWQILLSCYLHINNLSLAFQEAIYSTVSKNLAKISVVELNVKEVSGSKLDSVKYVIFIFKTFISIVLSILSKRRE